MDQMEYGIGMMETGMLCLCTGVIIAHRRVLNYSNLKILKSFSRGMLNKLMELISGFLQELSNIALTLDSCI